MDVDANLSLEPAMNSKSGSSIEAPIKEKAPEKQKRTRDEKRERKKDDKSVEHVLKALNSLDTTEEKLAAMCKKYADIFNDHRMLQNVTKQSEKRCSILQREKEQLQAEQSKAILTRNRLENLCRELQRQNKAVKEESMMRIREEEEKRKEVSAKFQATLSEITNMMQLNTENNTKLRDDNLDMNAKLKDFCQQYDRREQQVQKLVKEMQLEMQLADAKLAKAKMEMAQEMEVLLKEKQQLLFEIATYKSQLEEMTKTEGTLRSQISIYSNKYDEFYKALIQSNEAIDGFKAEMERLSKQIRRLEKETSVWKNRYEVARSRLAAVAQEKIKTDDDLASSNRKLVALQSLCRTLQAQCHSLRAQVGDSGNTPPVPSPAPELMESVETCPRKSATSVEESKEECPRDQPSKSAKETCTPHQDLPPSLGDSRVGATCPSPSPPSGETQERNTMSSESTDLTEEASKGIIESLNSQDYLFIPSSKELTNYDNASEHPVSENSVLDHPKHSATVKTQVEKDNLEVDHNAFSLGDLVKESNDTVNNHLMNLATGNETNSDTADQAAGCSVLLKELPIELSAGDSSSLARTPTFEICSNIDSGVDCPCNPGNHYIIKDISDEIVKDLVNERKLKELQSPKPITIESPNGGTVESSSDRLVNQIEDGKQSQDVLINGEIPLENESGKLEDPTKAKSPNNNKKQSGKKRGKHNKT